MHKLSRSLFAGFVAMGALVACDDVDTTPPSPQVTAVNVVPQNVQVSVGGTATLAATVLGDAGLTDRTVTWTSSNTSVATVDASGTVRGVAAGQTTIIARSNADPNVQGAAAVVVTPQSVPAVSIGSISRNGVPVDISNVQGQIDVTLNVAGNNAAVSGVQLFVKCPNNTANELVYSQTFSGNTAPNAPIVASFNTAQLNAALSGARFTNGACQLIAQLQTPAGTPAAQPVVFPLTFQNVDVVQATVTSSRGPAADQAGQPWRGGDITVRVVPVIYSGQTASSVTVTLTGTETDGDPFVRTQTVTGTFPQNVVFPGTGTGATSVAGITVPNVQVVATAAGANNILIPTPGLPTAFNLDNQAPVAGAYVINAGQGNANNWIGTAYTFNTTTGNGYVAGITPQGGNDFGGVDRVTVVYEAAPINTNTQTCTSTQTGLTFAAVTSGSNLQSSQVNGISPAGPSYCLRMVESDALGNSRTTYIGVFGVDREAPRFVQAGDQNVADNASFDIDGIDQVPTDAFPVVGTVAQAATRFWAFTLRDTLSGFDATPVNYTLTRLDAAGTACVVGSGTGCVTPTDGAGQIVVADSTDRTVRILVSNGTVTEGYYTFNGTIRDQAANSGATALPTRRVLVDGTAPVVSRVGLPGTLLAGNTTATFNFDATDNLDLYLANASLTYTGVAVIRSANQQIGTPFDATLTRSLTNQTVTFANFYRSLTASVGTAGVKPSSVGVRVIDAATNESAANTRAIDPQDVATSTLVFNGAATQLQSFQIVTAQNVGSAGTLLASPNCDEDTATCTITVRAQGPTGTFENPFAGVNLYMRDQATGELLLLSPTPNTAGQQTDNGVNRFYTYTFAVPTPAAGTFFNLFAIGFTASGDAILSNEFAVTIVP